MTLKINIPIAVYCVTMRFIVSDNIAKEYERRCAKHKLSESKWESWDAVFRLIESEPHVFVDIVHLTHNTIAHEVFHASNRICEHRAIEDEETKAWLNGYLIQEIYKGLEKNKLKVNHV